MTDTNAPAVTMEHIESQIDFEHYFTAFEGVIGEQVHHDGGETPELPVVIQDELRLMTFCIVILKNGFKVVGQASCASPERYNKEIGQKFARENAVQQLWQILGYELKTMLHTIKSAEHGIDESLTRMTAMAFGNADVFTIKDADNILKYFKGQGVEA